MLFDHKKAVSYSIDTDINHGKSTVYRTESARANQLSQYQFGGQTQKFLTMNDDRRKIQRNYSRDFKKSDQESQLFTNRVRRVQLQTEEKQEKSIPRKYKNESQISVVGTRHNCSAYSDPPATGVRKVRLSPKVEKITTKKHFQEPKQQPTQQSVFIVEKVNLCDNYGNKTEPKLMISLGKKKVLGGQNSNIASNFTSKDQSPGCLTERRHFTIKSNNQTSMKKIITNQNAPEQINFKVEYFKKNERIPDAGKSKNSFSKFQSRITHQQSGPAERLMQRFRHY